MAVVFVAHEGVVWSDRDGLENLVWWKTTRKALDVIATENGPRTTNELAGQVSAVAVQGEHWMASAKAAKYRYEDFLKLLVVPPVPVASKKAPVKKPKAK